MLRRALALFFATQLAFAPVGQAETLKSCADLFRDLVDRPEDSLSRRSLLSAPGLRLPAPTPESAGPPTTLLILPSNQHEQRTMFPERPILSAGLEQEYLQVRAAAGRTLENLRFASSANTLSNLKRSIAESGGSFVTVIGHNENGLLRLPDGDTIHLGDLGRIASRENKILIALSCRSSEALGGDSVGVSKDLTYGQAVELARLVNDHLAQAASRGPLDLGTLRQALEDTLAGQTVGGQRIRVDALTQPVVGGSILLAIVIGLCEAIGDGDCL